MKDNEKETRQISKFLSLVLRHQPDKIGITLDDAGWTSVDGLLEAMRQNRRKITREALDTAETVGARRGVPVLLRIRSQQMASAGHLFFVTANNVWLTDHVPASFIEFPET